MKLLWWIILLPVIAIVATFAVANRAPVGINLDPLPLIFDIPLYAALMAAVLIGLLIGGSATWIAGGHWRRETRRLRKDKKSLESEIDGLRARLAAPVEPSLSAPSQDAPTSGTASETLDTPLTRQTG